MDVRLKLSTYSETFNNLKVEPYINVLKKVHEYDINEIRKRGIAKIAFQISYLGEWIGDDIVRFFMEDKRFDVTVVIVWQRNLEQEEIGKLIKHFKEVQIPYCVADGKIKPKDFDVIFFTSPYLFAFDKWKDYEIPLSTLVCYCPYGFNVAKIQRMQYNLFAHNITWRKYALTKADIILSKHYCDIGEYGMVYSGYPKMDGFINQKPKYSPWKIADESAAPLKIIWAPHHSINEEPFHATFTNNFEWMYQYAKNHQSTTTWLFKPHPLLGISCVKNGIFKTLKDYNDYCDKWNALPNGTTELGEYRDWFITSDCMIFDSLSFMCEYMYVDKPCLFLMRDKSKFNELGDLAIKTMLVAQGDDYDKIENFINIQVAADPMKEARNAFKRDMLDYYSENSMTATEFIYKDISYNLFERTE